MRIYLAADAEALRQLRDGSAISAEAHLPASDDEVDEFEAMAATAAPGSAVVAAEVDAVDDPVDLPHVAAFHVDIDGSGDLAWFAPQEIDQVIEVLQQYR